MEVSKEQSGLLGLCFHQVILIWFPLVLLWYCLMLGWHETFHPQYQCSIWYMNVLWIQYLWYHCNYRQYGDTQDSDRFWIFGVYMARLLVDWVSTFGVSEGIYWLLHGEDWVIEEFMLLLKWVFPPLPNFSLSGFALLVIVLPPIWLNRVAYFLCASLGNFQFMLPWVRLRMMPWVWK